MAAAERGAVVEVAAGLIQDAEGRYLITQRRPDAHLAGFWEFPGGKREPGETLEECLRRELREELGVECAVGELVETVRWVYPDRTVVVHFYRCRFAGPVEPRERQGWAWVEPSRLPDYLFPPADRVLVARLSSG